MLTYYAAWQVYKNSAGAAGTARLARYINEDGSGGAGVRVCYAGCELLDRYAEASDASPDGTLGEHEIEALAAELGVPELAYQLIELRVRHLKANAETRGGGYTALPGDDRGHPGDK